MANEFGWSVPPAALVLGDPPTLHAIGNTAILSRPSSANNRAVVSGFQTPVEKEFLAILIRGKSPVIIYPARSLAKPRLSPEWKAAIADGRLLILSPFPANQHRATRENCDRRNQLPAALANDIALIHAASGRRLEAILPALNSKTASGMRDPDRTTPPRNRIPHASHRAALAISHRSEPPIPLCASCQMAGRVYNPAHLLVAKVTSDSLRPPLCQ